MVWILSLPHRLFTVSTMTMRYIASLKDLVQAIIEMRIIFIMFRNEK